MAASHLVYGPCHEIGFWRLGRRYMVFPACNSSPGQIHICSKRHIRGTKPGHNGICCTDGSTVFSTSADSFPFKPQGPQPTIPPTEGGMNVQGVRFTSSSPMLLVRDSAASKHARKAEMAKVAILAQARHELAACTLCARKRSGEP